LLSLLSLRKENEQVIGVSLCEWGEIVSYWYKPNTHTHAHTHTQIHNHILSITRTHTHSNTASVRERKRERETLNRCCPHGTLTFSPKTFVLTPRRLLLECSRNIRLCLTFCHSKLIFKSNNDICLIILKSSVIFIRLFFKYAWTE